MEVNDGCHHLHHRILIEFSDASGCARINLFDLLCAFYAQVRMLQVRLFLAGHLLNIFVKGLEDGSVLRARRLTDLKRAFKDRDLLLQRITVIAILLQEHVHLVAGLHCDLILKRARLEMRLCRYSADPCALRHVI